MQAIDTWHSSQLTDYVLTHFTSHNPSCHHHNINHMNRSIPIYLLTPSIQTAYSGQATSEDELWVRVNLFECTGCTFIEDALGFEAVVFIEVVFGHAFSKLIKIRFAELGKNSISWRALVLSWEEDDTLVDKGWLFLGTTEHVDHIFHRHVFLSFLLKIN